jgi:hypothetical protein
MMMMMMMMMMMTMMMTMTAEVSHCPPADPFSLSIDST